MTTPSTPSSAQKLVDQLRSKPAETVAEFKEAIKSSTEQDLTSLQEELNRNRELALNDEERTNLTQAIEELEREREVDQNLAGLEGRLDRIRTIFAIDPSSEPPSSSSSTNVPPKSSAEIPATEVAKRQKQLQVLKAPSIGKKVTSMVVKPVAKLLSSLGGRFGITEESIESAFWGLVQSGKVPLLGIPILGQKMKEEADARVALAQKKGILNANIKQAQQSVSKPIRLNETGIEELITLSDEQISATQVKQIADLKLEEKPESRTVDISIVDLKNFTAMKETRDAKEKAKARETEQAKEAEREKAVLEAFGFEEGKAQVTKGSPAKMVRGEPVRLTLNSVKTPEGDGPDKTLLLVHKVLTAANEITVGADSTTVEKRTGGAAVSIPAGMPAETAGLLNGVCEKIGDVPDIKKVSYKESVPSANSTVKFERASGELILSPGNQTLQTIVGNGFPPQVKETTETAYFEFTNGSWSKKIS